jgi:trk system potassium uptake protein TrkA
MHRDNILIVGCGRLGANLANTMSDEGKSVVIIDSDKASFNKLSPSFGGITVLGDAMDLAVLNEAEITKAGAVITVTNKDNTNIMVAQIAKEMFHIDEVVARLYDLERDVVYKEFGIRTFCPAVLSTKEVDRLLTIWDSQGDEL